ncbi:PA5502 family lipoprotein [Zestomonas carbonaria]|uniref:Lipoprotein n=1 Tax=Zestomonas carbonaria TaxID=2762745 RepID=A0A7U7EL77_9GAMM|nr:PA5502 family lipoprotein [Pseudomonas carbonaria]CAD5106678.1 hypothetical protein PSEWESI4_00945 [Pseudomonas carbonaria]
MSLFTSRYLAIAALSLLLSACQSAPQQVATLPVDELVSAFSQLEQSIERGELERADEQLAALQPRAAGDTRLESLQRRLADAYLQQGQGALQRGDLDSAAQALGRARGLMPQAPALTTGLDEAIGQARSTEQQAAMARAAAEAKAREEAARLEQARQLREAAERQAAAIQPQVSESARFRPLLIDPNAKTSVVPLPMLDSHDNEALRDLLDSVAADVVHYDCAVRVQVRQAKDYPWVASLLSARVKRLQPGYALRLVQDLKPDETPRLVLSPRNP